MKKIFLAVSISFVTINLCAQNVGINTVTPSAYGHGGNSRLLEIYNENVFNNSQAHLLLTDSSISGAVGSVTWASRAISNSEKRIGIIAAQFDATATTASPKSVLKFYTHNGSSIVENLTINPIGNIGIGNTNPSFKLHLGSSNGSLRIEGPSTASTGGAAISVGGFGEIQIDKPGVVGGRFMIKENGSIGINNINPNAPLSFAPALGKKITLYPGATGDVGFGVAGNRLQIYSDNPNADVAIGYDAAGTFNERFAVKPTGALAVNGNTGAAGQVLMSNGSGSAATWTSVNQVLYREGSTANITTNYTTAPFPQETNMVISVSQSTRVIFNIGVGIYNNCNVGPCYPTWDFEILKDGSILKTVGINSLSTSVRYTSNHSLGPFAFDITPGTYTFGFRGFVVQVGSIGGMASMNMSATATLIPL